MIASWPKDASLSTQADYGLICTISQQNPVSLARKRLTLRRVGVKRRRGVEHVGFAANSPVSGQVSRFLSAYHDGNMLVAIG
jgi:hypothetical protein